jgi:hypothetical protein
MSTEEKTPVMAWTLSTSNNPAIGKSLATESTTATARKL